MKEVSLASWDGAYCLDRVVTFNQTPIIMFVMFKMSQHSYGMREINQRSVFRNLQYKFQARL